MSTEAYETTAKDPHPQYYNEPESGYGEDADFRDSQPVGQENDYYYDNESDQYQGHRADQNYEGEEDYYDESARLASGEEKFEDEYVEGAAYGDDGGYQHVNHRGQTEDDDEKKDLTDAKKQKKKNKKKKKNMHADDVEDGRNGKQRDGDADNDNDDDEYFDDEYSYDSDDDDDEPRRDFWGRERHGFCDCCLHAIAECCRGFCIPPGLECRRCCACPHGPCYTAMGVALGIGGIVMSVLYVINCDVERIIILYNGEVPPNAPRITYGFMSREPTFEETPDYMQCKFYTAEEKPGIFDVWMKASRMFVFVSTACGIIGGIFLCLALCVAFTPHTFEHWMFWTYMIAAITIPLSYLIFGSQLCSENDCKLGQGGVQAISIFLFWLCAGNTVKSFPAARPRELREGDEGYEEGDEDDLYYETEEEMWRDDPTTGNPSGNQMDPKYVDDYDEYDDEDHNKDNDGGYDDNDERRRDYDDDDDDEARQKNDYLDDTQDANQVDGQSADWLNEYLPPDEVGDQPPYTDANSANNQRGVAMDQQADYLDDGAHGAPAQTYGDGYLGSQQDDDDFLGGAPAQTSNRGCGGGAQQEDDFLGGGHTQTPPGGYQQEDDFLGGAQPTTTEEDGYLGNHAPDGHYDYLGGGGQKDPYQNDNFVTNDEQQRDGQNGDDEVVYPQQNLPRVGEDDDGPMIT